MRDDGKEYVSHEKIVLLGGIQGCQNASNFFSRIPRSARLVTSNANLTDDHQKTAGLEKRNSLERLREVSVTPSVHFDGIEITIRIALYL